ncbi:MAG: ATP-binding protein [Deltaproteobacteria bacterium]|jgi:hypothetical protein|nr:ATP-binding protein [Deltaproteobacteria bacterium]MDL1988865.1 ATP-binding protein [Deltaproteobacteria bacterium]
MKKTHKKVLIVGDWLVDEHWVTGVHRSSTSSRTGDAHYRALHSLTSTVKSFCGAGQTASLLYNIHHFGTNPSQYNITGIGLWHKDDTQSLESMFELANLRERTPYRITPKKLTKVDRVKLINLHTILDENEQNQVCTTRILRIYDAVSSDDVRFQRIDWELPLPRHEKQDSPGYSVLLDESRIETAMNKIISKINKEIDIVIIKDFCKGVVTMPLVKVLANKYKEKEWYVSTKAWNPSWLEELKKVNLKLLLIPQVAARAAIIATSHEPISCWLTPSGKPDLKVYKKIDALLDKVKHTSPKESNEPQPLVIVLPEFYQVITYNPNINRRKHDDDIDLKTPIKNPKEVEYDCVIQATKSPRKKVVPMAMASIFFSLIIDALSHHVEHHDVTANKMTIMIDNALRRTHEWIKFEGDRIKKPASWDPAMGHILLKNTNSFALDLHLDFIQSNWHYDKARWSQATNGIGVINTQRFNEPPVSRFELWRSMSEVKGYVCLDGTKRGELRKLNREVRHFVAKPSRHHTACMLVASPGSGKTYLVRQLAESMSMRSLNFNITQMSSRTDLIDCFDTIVTTQARNRGEPLVIFIDEINAVLEGNPVYDAFLSPLEDGVYVRGGKVFHIDPCIWIFSGTEDPSLVDQNQSKTKRATDKKSDFVSRLSLGIMDIRRPEGSTKGPIENVYMGVNIIINEYPDVRYVSDKVLKLLHALQHDIGVRTIKNFVKSFTDIQYGEVWAKNISETRIKEIMGEEKFNKWNSKSSEKRIIIEL